jgi:hypothetical protein
MIPHRQNRMSPSMRAEKEEKVEKVQRSPATEIQEAKETAMVKLVMKEGPMEKTKNPAQTRRKEAVSLDDLSGC